MNNEENKNQDLTYDFNFDDQVVKNEPKTENNEVEILDDNQIEELEEVNETTETIENEPIIENEPKIEELQEEILEESNQETNNETKNDDTSNKKIKILGKEFMFEDVILVVIGLIIIVAIFLLPKIMKLFG